jgi:hypothetical protein
MRPGLNRSATALHELRRVVLEPQQGFWETAARRVTAKLLRVTRERLAGSPAETPA